MLYKCLILLLALVNVKIVAGQDGAGIDGLPECATTCAETAAQAAQCSLQPLQTSCLCGSAFVSATVTCASHVCAREDQPAVRGILSNLCAGATTSTTGGGATLPATTVTIPGGTGSSSVSTTESQTQSPSPSPSSPPTESPGQSTTPSTSPSSSPSASSPGPSTASTPAPSSSVSTPTATLSISTAPGPVIPSSTSSQRTVIVTSTSLAAPSPSRSVAASSGAERVGGSLWAAVGALLGVVVAGW